MEAHLYRSFLVALLGEVADLQSGVEWSAMVWSDTIHLCL
jgi:hypothetical protein